MNALKIKKNYVDLHGMLIKEIEDKSAINESPVNVFFDNLQVVHTRGPVRLDNGRNIIQSTKWNSGE